MIAVECDESRIDYRLRTGYVDKKQQIDEALSIIYESETPVSDCWGMPQTFFQN